MFLGIPDADIERVKHWSAGRALLTWGRLPTTTSAVSYPDFVDYLRFCFDFVSGWRVEPGDDYTSELLRRLDTEHPDDFDAGRVAQTLFGLLMAGDDDQPGDARRPRPARRARRLDRVSRDRAPHPGRGRRADPLRLQRGRLAPPGARRGTAVGGHRAGRGAAAGAPRIGQPRTRGAVHRRRPSRARPTQLSASTSPSGSVPTTAWALRSPASSCGCPSRCLTQRLPTLELVPTTYSYSPNTSHRGPTTLPVRLAAGAEHTRRRPAGRV